MGFGGGGGNGSISGASDAALNSPANNQVLTYDSAVSKWKNATIATGAGLSELLVIKYSGGSYPALPASKPAGVNLILFKGPDQPTSLNVNSGIPSYVGDGANQIMADYEYRLLA